MRERKTLNLSLIMMVLIATLVPMTMTMTSFWIPAASGFPGGQNGSNMQHNYSGGDGAPTSWSPTSCEAGSCNVFFNFTVIDKNNAENVEDMVEGGMNPVNQSLWIHLNDTSNTTWYRNWTGDAGPTSNGVFIVTRADITTYGKINVSYEWSVPAYFTPGDYYVNFNVTDNATTFTSSEIWENDTYITVTGEGINAELLDPNGVDRSITNGRWGNITVDAGATNQEWDAHYVRLENSGSYPTQQATVNFISATLSSAGTGDSIPIDTNLEWTGCWTNSSSDNPGNNFVTEGSTWIAWQSDTSGSHEFQFYATGEYIWVKIRWLVIPSPLSGATDYDSDYTVTASGVG